MMTCSNLSPGQASTYFEHESDYYTKNLDNNDRWHGSLAKTLGFEGQLKKEQFDLVLEHIKEKGRSLAGVDCTFSAPKSVSLSLAKDEKTRNDMTKAHQKAVEKIAEAIEIKLAQTMKGENKVNTHNLLIGEFNHKTARPTKENNFVPDLDLHSHLVVANMTILDGQDYHVDYSKIMDKQTIFEYGLMYRQELAQELQNMGYELEITDTKNGFFEVKGFDREIIEEYSHRREQIVKTAEEHGIKDMQKANQFSREKKDKSTKSFEEICADVKKNIFDNKRVEIRKENKENERDYAEDYAKERSRIDGNIKFASRTEDFVARGFNTNFTDTRGFTGQPFESFSRRYSLQDLSSVTMDGKPQRDNLLLSKTDLSNLAKHSTKKTRDTYLRWQNQASNKERKERINEIGFEAIKKLSNEKFAFTPLEARRRIMSAGVLENITMDEARTIMDRAGLVDLGQMKTKNGKTTHDRYYTTEANLQKEHDIVQRMLDGKGQINKSVLTLEESQEALNRLEAKANEEGRTNFYITNGSGEQAKAVHHILTSNDRFIGVDGLAGTGKTTMMERLKWIADEKGITVKGVCFTGKAADGLQADSKIDSTTIHAFLNNLEREGNPNPPEKTEGIKQEWNFDHVKPCQGREIWAVDEAGLVDSNLMNELQKACIQRNAQLLLLGDPDQLPPVGAGTPMQDMEKAGMSTANLTDIRRQKNAELLEAVRESVKGDTLTTYKKLDDLNSYHQIEDRADRMTAIKEEMTQAPIEQYKDNLLLVSTNKDRKDYNKAIRQEYIDKGELEKGEKFKITVNSGEREVQESRYFAEKDRIIFTANDNQLGIKNGTMATIHNIDGHNIEAVTDDNKTVKFSMDDYNKIDHSYAVTNYKSQGMTVDKAVVDMNTNGKPQARNDLYVDISRARYNAVVYTDNKEKLEKQTKDFAEKIKGEAFKERIDQLKEKGITKADRYQNPDQGQFKELEKALADIRKNLEQPKEIHIEKETAEITHETTLTR